MPYIDTGIDMDKTINKIDSDIFCTQTIDFDYKTFNKIASESFVPPSLELAMRHIRNNPDPKMVYLYDRALGAGEIYGPNNNGDFFTKSDLINRHNTFVTHGAVYRHHKSKGPSIGEVVESAYNHKLDVVDLIIKCPLFEVAKDLEKLQQGQTIATSMGAGMKFDVCSYCGNKSRSRAQYCTHLKYRMLKVMPDGTMIYAINPEPTFKDISIVLIPAEPASGVLLKVASEGCDFDFSSHRDHKTGYYRQRGAINPVVLEKLARRFSPIDIVSTLHHAKGPLRPDEFSAILNKDASIVDPRVNYFVFSDGHTLYDEIFGDVIPGLSEQLSKVANLTPGLETRVFPFSDYERSLYFGYRTATNSLNGDFIR